MALGWRGFGAAQRYWALVGVIGRGRARLRCGWRGWRSWFGDFAGVGRLLGGESSGLGGLGGGEVGGQRGLAAVFGLHCNLPGDL